MELVFICTYIYYSVDTNCLFDRLEIKSFASSLYLHFCILLLESYIYIVIFGIVCWPASCEHFSNILRYHKGHILLFFLM
jgi:hypothetical protein